MDRFLYHIERAMVWLALAMALPLAAARAQTFLTIPVNLSGTGSAAFPSIAVGPSGDINVVWLDSGAILFRRSVDGGQTFSAAMRVATTNLPSQPSRPQIAANSAGVYVAWAGTNASGGGDVFFSSFSGGSWSSSPANVSGGNGIAAGTSAPVPHMAVDPNGGVDIVWGQSEAWFWRSRDGASVRLTTSAMAKASPRMAINAQRHIFVVWENAGTCPTITFARSTDGGATFADYSVDDTLTLSDGSRVTGCASDVQIAVGANNTIWLLWANDNPIQDLPITYAIDSDSSFSGTNFPETYFENLSGTASFTPGMAIDSAGNIDVVWIGDVSQTNSAKVVYFSRSTNPQQGGTFCGGPNDPACPNPPVLTGPPAAGAKATDFPQIATESSGAIDIVWQQASAANPGGAYDIVLARSTDGMNFTKSTLNNAPTTQGGTGQLATDGSANVFSVWQGSSGSGGDVLLNGDSAGLRVSAQFSLNGVKVSVSPASAVINVGGSASFNLSVSSTNSVSGSLTLACGGAPAGVSCSFPNPISVPANGSTSATLSVSVAVKPSGSAVERNPGEFRRWPGLMPLTIAWVWGIAVAACLAALAAEQRMRSTSPFARVLVLTLLVAIAATGMISCGGSTSSGGGGGGSITFPLTLQAQANSGTASMQTISITVP